MNNTDRIFTYKSTKTKKKQQNKTTSIQQQIKVKKNQMYENDLRLSRIFKLPSSNFKRKFNNNNDDPMVRPSPSYPNISTLNSFSQWFCTLSVSFQAHLKSLIDCLIFVVVVQFGMDVGLLGLLFGWCIRVIISWRG